jgi:hypothetical protein
MSSIQHLFNATTVSLLLASAASAQKLFQMPYETVLKEDQAFLEKFEKVSRGVKITNYKETPLRLQNVAEPVGLEIAFDVQNLTGGKFTIPSFFLRKKNESSNSIEMKRARVLENIWPEGSPSGTTSIHFSYSPSLSMVHVSPEGDAVCFRETPPLRRSEEAFLNSALDEVQLAVSFVYKPDYSPPWHFPYAYDYDTFRKGNAPGEGTRIFELNLKEALRAAMVAQHSALLDPHYWQTMVRNMVDENKLRAAGYQEFTLESELLDQLKGYGTPRCYRYKRP